MPFFNLSYLSFHWQNWGKCLQLGGFNDRLKKLQYAQKQGVQEGEV